MADYITNKRNVAIYARVSTEHEAQLSALENQKNWYKPLLEQHPEWHVVRMYIDEGITGTSAHKRPQFMKMIDDANNGEFDLILTREVSRFARNTVDTLQYTRKLKEHGIEVFFINDNIKTFDGDGELRLTIMATLAQDESRKTSIRVKSGQQTSMEKGVFYGNGNILGYDRVGKEMIVNPEQANTVKMIFDMYLNGMGIREIKYKLEQLGRLTATGKTRWYETNISKILKNTFYCGIMTFHKEFTPDFLTQKKIRNCGDIELTKVHGTHTPIISPTEFEKAQQIMKSRKSTLKNTGDGKRREIGKKKPVDIWTDLLICECNHKFNRKIWHRKDNEIQYGYECYASVRTGKIKTRIKKGVPIDGICEVPMIAGWKLQMMAKYVFQHFINNTVEVITLAVEMLNKHLNDSDSHNDIDIQEIETKINKLTKRLDNLVEMRADGEISKDVFMQKKEDVENQLRKLHEQLDLLKPDDIVEEDQKTHGQKIELLKSYLENSVEVKENENIPNEIIKAFVKKIVAHKDGFDWYLRFLPEDHPHKINVEGKRQHTSKVSSLCYMQHRLLSAKEGNLKFTKICELLIDLDYAKNYRYAQSTKNRILFWHDLKINIFL